MAANLTSQSTSGESSHEHYSEHSEKDLLKSKEKLLSFIHDGCCGHRELFRTPFGLKPMIYADYTASGRSLEFIEKFIAQEVLPCYSNTHTTTTWVAQQTTSYRQEARKIIHRSVGGSEDDVVIFCGSGSTAAVNKLVLILKASMWGREEHSSRKSSADSYECALCHSAYTSKCKPQAAPCHSEQCEEEKDRIPVVFVSCYEHHSNLLPWRECGAKIEVVPENADGELDLDQLEARLEDYADWKYKIGSFCACSNISGIRTNTQEIARIMHARGGLVFFDYASGGPYQYINMNQSEETKIDAIFLSPHKFPGGPNTPGILVVKKRLLGNKVPTVPGGGTVFFVTQHDHAYLLNYEEREEGGTPDIVGSIRAGLVFQLKDAVSPHVIEEIEDRLKEKAMDRFLANKNIVLLGNPNAPRLPTLSFLVRCGRRFLHQNFVSLLLNDLFGVESRSGCACAGPYAQDLLGISYDLAKSFISTLYDGQEIYKPGFVRANLPYFSSEEEIDYILDAIEFVAKFGYWFLPMYKCDMYSAEFSHRCFGTNKGDCCPRRWLHDISYEGGEMQYPVHTREKVASLSSYMQEAYGQLETIKQHGYKDLDLPDQTIGISKAAEELRWFVLPSEMLAHLRARSSEPFMCAPAPFDPPPQIRKPKRERKEPTLKFRIPLKLRSLTSHALSDFLMLRPGDRILIGVSGGAASMVLLHLLLHSRSTSRFPFSIAACAVDPQYSGYDPSPLITYFAEIGVPLYYESEGIFVRAKENTSSDEDARIYCEKRIRGVLYACMRKNGYNVLALGSHLDDLAENFFMAKITCPRAMSAHYMVEQGDLRVIRPLIYLREQTITKFANEVKLPILKSQGLYSSPEHQRIKSLLALQERVNPELFSHLIKSLKPLLLDVLDIKKSTNADEETIGSESEDEDGQGQDKEQPSQVALTEKLMHAKCVYGETVPTLSQAKQMQMNGVPVLLSEETEDETVLQDRPSDCNPQ